MLITSFNTKAYFHKIHLFLSLQGFKGGIGSIGPPGSQGLNGVDGFSGADGSNGLEGINGEDGLLGGSGVPVSYICKYLLSYATDY